MSWWCGSVRAVGSSSGFYLCVCVNTEIGLQYCFSRTTFVIRRYPHSRTSLLTMLVHFFDPYLIQKGNILMIYASLLLPSSSSASRARRAAAMEYSSGPFPPMNATRPSRRMTRRSGKAPNDDEAAFLMLSAKIGIGARPRRSHCRFISASRIWAACTRSSRATC